MIQIGDIVVSKELFDKRFICDLPRCEGNCCVYGDSGAPLTDEEVRFLESHLGKIRPFMRAEGQKAVADQGAWVMDNDGDHVTPLVDGEECAYALFEENIARCAIERASEAGAIHFQKPESCHLYPIRVTPLKNGMALNYHQWSICEPARILGAEKGIPVFRFLKTALVRVYGQSFYDEMEEIYREMK
jgi:hypothetical protein